MKLIMTTALVLAISPTASARSADESRVATPAATATVDSERAQLAAMLLKLSQGDEDGLIDSIRALVDAPAFEQLSAKDQFIALNLLGSALFAAGDKAQAHAALVRASALPMATPGVWRLRLSSADREDKAEALQCLTIIAQRWPDSLSGIPFGAIAETLHDTQNRPEFADARFKTIEALWLAHWPGPDAEFPPDQIWQSLSASYLDQGRTAEAAAVVTAITDPTILARLISDPRYDQLRIKLADHFDIAKAHERYLVALRAFAAAHPTKLHAVVSVIGELSEQGETEQALTLADATLAKIKAAPTDQPAFVDTNQWLPWLNDRRAKILRELGRFDEAVTALTDASKAPGTESQSINLGLLLNSLARPNEALAAVASVREADVSNYGQMEVWLVRACAYAQLGRASDYQLALQAVQHALLCDNEGDAAATALITRLREPLERAAALNDVNPVPPPAAALRFDKIIDERTRALLARADVRTAIETAKAAALPAPPP
jgi:tetratricopeptide (TPR) repeat protein